MHKCETVKKSDKNMLHACFHHFLTIRPSLNNVEVFRPLIGFLIAKTIYSNINLSNEHHSFYMIVL